MLTKILEIHKMLLTTCGGAMLRARSAPSQRPLKILPPSHMLQRWSGSLRPGCWRLRKVYLFMTNWNHVYICTFLWYLILISDLGLVLVVSEVLCCCLFVHFKSSCVQCYYPAISREKFCSCAVSLFSCIFHWVEFVIDRWGWLVRWNQFVQPNKARKLWMYQA